MGLTSLYLDTNGNEKLNKKDLLIATGGFKQSLYKKKKGDLLATNREEAMFEAMSDLLSTPPPEDFNFVYNTGTIFTNKKGKHPISSLCPRKGIASTKLDWSLLSAAWSQNMFEKVPENYKVSNAIVVHRE